MEFLDWDINTNWVYWTEDEEELFKKLLIRFNITTDNHKNKEIIESISQVILTKSKEDIEHHLNEHYKQDNNNYGLYTSNQVFSDLEFLNNEHRQIEANFFDSNPNILTSINNLNSPNETQQEHQHHIINQEEHHHDQLDAYQIDEGQYEENQKIIQENIIINNPEEINSPIEKEAEPDSLTNKRKRTSTSSNNITINKPTKTTKTAKTTKTSTAKTSKTAKTNKPEPKKTSTNTPTLKKKPSKVNEKEDNFEVTKIYQDWMVSKDENVQNLKNLFISNEKILGNLVNGLQQMETNIQKQLMKEFYDNYNNIVSFMNESKMSEKLPDLPINLNTYFISDVLNNN
eukprot:TRINITY_DN725_c1_g1_i1.p1 TRINITY_DN725_c1_g1~~TRINITY_DN725_c1_g1_i1.p1  ORF type:complete len:344 (+),score=78.69 TRINITY_DN725_c1_g1_i1:45-1076(+)